MSQSELEHGAGDALEPELRQLLLGGAARIGDADRADRAAARQVLKRFRSRERRNRLVVVAATVVSLATAVALTLRLHAPSGAVETAARPAVTANASRYALQSGAATTPSGRAFALGLPLEAGTVVLGAGACIAGSNERLCARMPLGAVVMLPQASEPQVVTLLRGGVSLTAESGASVATIRGGVVALSSALFTLDLDGPPASMIVAVQSGSVRYRDPEGVEGALFEGQSVRLPVPPPSERVAPAAPVTLEAAPSSAPFHPAPPPSAPSAASAGELLELARQERAARHYSAAALAYRKLEQTFPGSAEARAALVSLGQLQLGQLGQPEAALRSFQTYLAAPGQLQQEAEHGNILALQKLGRKAEERRAIDAFIARYPKSVQAGALKERLKQL